MTSTIIPTIILTDALAQEQQVLAHRIDTKLQLFNKELNAMLQNVVTGGLEYTPHSAHAFSTLYFIYHELDDVFLMCQQLDVKAIKEHYQSKVTNMMHNVINLRDFF